MICFGTKQKNSVKLFQINGSTSTSTKFYKVRGYKGEYEGGNVSLIAVVTNWREWDIHYLCKRGLFTNLMLGCSLKLRLYYFLQILSLYAALRYTFPVP